MAEYVQMDEYRRVGCRVPCPRSRGHGQKTGCALYTFYLKPETSYGYVYHVLNHANGRLRIFRENADYTACEAILVEGLERIAMRFCGYCIMSIHWQSATLAAG